MTTEAEGKEQPQVPEPEAEVKPQPEQVTLSKEDLESLMAEAVNKGIAQREAEYKAKQRELSKKDLERKRQKQEPPVEDPGLKSLADAMAKAVESGDATLIRQVAAEIDQRKRMEAERKIWDDHVARGEAGILSLIYSNDLDPEDDRLEPVMDILDLCKSTGNFNPAEKKLNKILNKIKEQPKEEAKVEPKEEPKEPKEEEILKYLKEKKGIDLTTDVGSPAGGKGLTPEMVEKMSPEERFARSEEIAKMPLGYKSLK